MNNLKTNGSGCNDPTACRAISRVDRDTEKNKIKETIASLKEEAGRRGLSIENRIILKDKITGKIFR